jgi:hypothetical protein
MKAWPQAVEDGLHRNFFDLPGEIYFRFPLYEKVHNHQINTWDIQWGFAKHLNSGLSIIPRNNLVSNIGHGFASTHTSNPKSSLANIPRQEIEFPLKHPLCILRNRELEMDIDRKLSEDFRKKPKPNVASSLKIRPPLKIGFLTSLGVNVGDEFIREGIRAVLDDMDVPYTPLYVHKLSESSLNEPSEDESEIVKDKYWDSDLFIQGGAPVYWHLLDGTSTSLNSHWHKWMWEDRILRQDRSGPVFINLGAGSCQPWGDTGDSFIADSDCVHFARAAAERSSLTTVRDPVAAHILEQIQIPHEALPCPAFLASCRHRVSPYLRDVIGVNLMHLGGHYNLLHDFDSGAWENKCAKLIEQLRKLGSLVFVAHDEEELKFDKKFSAADERIFSSNSWRDYFDIYSACSVVLTNRVHGAVCAAGFGIPSVIIGNDTRAMIGDYIGIPRYKVTDFNVSEITDKLNSFLNDSSNERSRLLELRDLTITRYKNVIEPVIEKMDLS